MSDSVIEVKGVTKHFPMRGGLMSRGPKQVVKAVDGIDFVIRDGETFSLVGESGCGKTTTAKVVLGIEPPTAGSVLYQGKSVYRPGGGVLSEYRQAVNAVFQDPWSSLDPRMRVGAIVAEPLQVNGHVSRQEVRERVASVLTEVGLAPRDAARYPHEFSGGQRQRIALARALALSPNLIVLDEPVSALDVSIRAQIMNLLKDLQAHHQLSYLLISHNLATVRYLSDTMAVMYLGKIVEIADSETVFSEPLHPYTKALMLAALPGHPRHRRDLIRLSGEVPSPLAPPPGCTFHPRCPVAMPVCSEVVPALAEAEPGRWVACHLYPSSTPSSAAASSGVNGAGASAPAPREPAPKEQP